MEIRHAVHPEQAKIFDTEQLRKNFLIRELFTPGKIRLVYSYYDRLIVGGIQPAGPLKLEMDERIIGSKYLLERREMGMRGYKYVIKHHSVPVLAKKLLEVMEDVKRD